MSKRRKEKKPQSKATQALLKQLQRRTEARDLEKRFLIVCEDSKSAPNYFEALKMHFRLTATSVEVARGCHHSQPVQVVERAIDRKNEADNSPDDPIPFDSVWCVIDGDYGKKIVNARAKAIANKVNMAISTPCFEYWVLLHMEDSARPANNCSQVITSLKKHLSNYDKGTFDFASVVVNVDDACQRAERLRNARVTTDPLPENHNPCSEIYKLIKELKAAGF